MVMARALNAAIVRIFLIQYRPSQSAMTSEIEGLGGSWPIEKADAYPAPDRGIPGQPGCAMTPKNAGLAWSSSASRFRRDEPTQWWHPASARCHSHARAPRQLHR